ESVKSSPSYETVFQILNMKKLRAEGFIEEQYLPSLKKGMKVVIERSAAQRPMLTLVGHLQEVTGVAVNRDARLIVSSSLDGTVWVWDQMEGKGIRKLVHPTEVKAVACTPPGAKANLCLSGGRDGQGRIWDLDSNSTTPLRSLNGKHHNAINCVAFSPDGAV